jgi:hypothetical protein
MADDLEQRLDPIYFQLVQHGRAWGAKAAPWRPRSRSIASA